jgi:hypothetical protein
LLNEDHQLVPTGLGNTSMAPSSGGGPVGPMFFGLLVTSTPTPYISRLATVFILVLLSDGVYPWTSAPSTVGGPASGFICALVPAGRGNTYMTVAELAADLIFVPASSMVSAGVAPWTSAPSIVGGPASGHICVLVPNGVGNTSTTVAEMAADLMCVPAASVSVSAAPSMLAGINTESTSRAVIFPPPPYDWLVFLLVLLSPREIGGRDAAVFEVLAEAYSARRGAKLCLSGLEAFRFGRSWLLVIDNLPLCTFILTGWVKPSSLPSVLVEGFLVGILVNLIAEKK